MITKNAKQIKYLDFPADFKKNGKAYMTAVKRVLSSGNYVLGAEVEKFEKEFAKFLGVKYCIGVANGLEAIQIALMSLNIGHGDEVITTPLSAVATTIAVLAVGATPVFVDIKENGQIDELLIEKAITKKTKAILPVHLYGQPADVEKIKQICKKYKLFLVEDCAQAHGAKLNGKKIGSFGEFGCYSFYPTKNLGAIGDGGAITTNDANLATICREIRDYGQKSKYIHTRLGLNSRLDELQAGILSEKLKFLKSDNEKRLKIARRYTGSLKNLRHLEVVLPDKFDDSVYHLMVVKTKRRDDLKKYLANEGIPSLIHFPISIPDQQMFKDKYRNLNIPVSRRFVQEILSIPCHPFLKFEEVDYISQKIKSFFD